MRTSPSDRPDAMQTMETGRLKRPGLALFLALAPVDLIARMIISRLCGEAGGERSGKGGVQSSQGQLSKYIFTYCHFYTGCILCLVLYLATKVAVQVVQCRAGNWNMGKHQATPPSRDRQDKQDKCDVGMRDGLTASLSLCLCLCLPLFGSRPCHRAILFRFIFLSHALSGAMHGGLQLQLNHAHHSSIQPPKSSRDSDRRLIY